MVSGIQLLPVPFYSIISRAAFQLFFNILYGRIEPIKAVYHFGMLQSYDAIGGFLCIHR